MFYFPTVRPSYDTYERVFQRIDPKIMLQFFQQWTNLFTSITKGAVVAINGKHMCGARVKNIETNIRLTHTSVWIKAMVELSAVRLISHQKYIG